MTIVFESILPIFAIVFLGYGLRKKGFVPAEHWKPIEDLCFWIFFPALLCTTLIRADLDQIALGPFTATLLLMMLSMAVLVLVSWPLLSRTWQTTPAKFSTIYQTTTRWHGFIALAIVIRLFGDEGAALIAVAFAVMIPILQVSNILVLAAFSSSKVPTLSRIFSMVASNPIIWGIIIGILVNRSGIAPWQPIMSMLDLLGQVALGVSLLALGAGLSLKAAMKPSRELSAGLFGKLLLTPLVMFAWASWLGVSGTALAVLMICASVPTAMNGYIIARKMGGDAELCAATASVQTAAAFFTIPLVLWAAGVVIS